MPAARRSDHIICPHCKGMVGRTWRGMALEEALERHVHLSHGIVRKVEAPAPAKPVLSKTPPRRKGPKR